MSAFVDGHLNAKSAHWQTWQTPENLGGEELEDEKDSVVATQVSSEALYKLLPRRMAFTSEKKSRKAREAGM
jgi:hypothetical protein